MSKPAWAAGARTGPVRSFMQLKLFACEGLICIIDERPEKGEGSFTVVTPSDLEERVHAVNKKYRNQTPAQMNKNQRELHYQRVNGGNNCIECVKEARHMGDPTDPAVQNFWMKHRRNSTFTFNFSPGADPAGYPTLPPVDPGKFTGRTAEVDGQIVKSQNLPNRSEMRIHKPPKRKSRNGLIILED